MATAEVKEQLTERLQAETDPAERAKIKAQITGKPVPCAPHGMRGCYACSGRTQVDPGAQAQAVRALAEQPPHRKTGTVYPVCPGCGLKLTFRGLGDHEVGTPVIVCPVCGTDSSAEPEAARAALTAEPESGERVW